MAARRVGVESVCLSLMLSNTWRVEVTITGCNCEVSILAQTIAGKGAPGGSYDVTVVLRRFMDWCCASRAVMGRSYWQHAEDFRNWDACQDRQDGVCVASWCGMSSIIIRSLSTVLH